MWLIFFAYSWINHTFKDESSHWGKSSANGIAVRTAGSAGNWKVRKSEALQACEVPAI